MPAEQIYAADSQRGKLTRLWTSKRTIAAVIIGVFLGLTGKILIRKGFLFRRQGKARVNLGSNTDRSH